MYTRKSIGPRTEPCGTPEDLFKHKPGSIAHSLSLSTTHRPDMAEKVLKRTKQHRKSSIHLSTSAEAVQGCLTDPHDNHADSLILRGGAVTFIFFEEPIKIFLTLDFQKQS